MAPEIEDISNVNSVLTHWGRVTHICVSKLTIIGSDNSLSPDRRQAIIWTNAGILLIGPLGTNFTEISIEILTFSFKKMRLKLSSAKRRPFCLGLNVSKLTPIGTSAVCIIGLCEGNHRWPADFYKKAPVRTEVFPWHGVIMNFTRVSH